MKRRETKKGIGRAEKWLAVSVQRCLEAHEHGDEGLKYKEGETACSMLASLLAWNLRLDPAWNDKERWIDGLINGHIHLAHPRGINVHGEMVWGLSRDTGGPQWKEPFCAVVRVAKANGKLRSYSLKFGKGAPLSEKLVRFGSYYILLPTEERGLSDSGEPACNYSEPDGGYSHCFSKGAEA